MPRLIFISDTHNLLHKIDVPSGDILIHCGDALARGTLDELETFAAVFAALPHQHKVYCAGNHDWPFERTRSLAEGILLRAGGITYLQDSEVTIEGLRIYGSPQSPRFYDWSFNVDRGPAIQRYWRNIPTGVDVLITHGPPHGILDSTEDGQHVGCEDLLEELKRIRPRVHAFGHIHGAYGTITQEGTQYINASNLNERYRVQNEPVVVDLSAKT